MRISEVFYSIQGEGRLLGVPSVFIRTSGCNLRCVWCDTPYSSWQPEGKSWSVKKLLDEVVKYPARHVVVTGGEPLLAPEVGTLTEQLKAAGLHITIETAATLFKPVQCDLISLSPKLANSTPWKRARGKFAAPHERRRLNLGVIQKYLDAHDYQLKFVVEQKADFGEIRRIIEQLRNVDAARVLIMAQGTTNRELNRRAKWIVEQCKFFGFSYTPRLHIQLFGNRRGT
ncbi:MAG: 7-carboxy-7-deazaguanine synthase QueE [Deltaproteobacteria bacterium]|nr:7-carboxy-7-deazaguanine synthase QueE [Deltaproteobacteria bacterium]